MKNFLKHFPNHWVMTLDDKACKGAEPKRETLWSIQKELGQNFTEEQLRDFNSKGAGIYFTPNQFTKQRKANLCEGINAWIMESDSITKEEQYAKLAESKLPPSIMVETQKSIHAYWLAKDGTLDRYTDIVKGLIQEFNGDPACKDVSRVFRIPTFYHCKKEPFLVNVLYADYSKVYAQEQMLEVFPYTKKEYREKIIAKPIVEGLDFWDAVSRFSNKEMLYRLSGTYMMNGESISFRQRAGGGEYIDVNGEPADCWLDAQGMIGSGKGASPTFVQWLEFYGWSKGDIAKWIKKYCSDLLPASALKKSYTKDTKKVLTPIVEEKEDDFSELEIIENPFTWGTPELDKRITAIEAGDFNILVGSAGAGKTTYAFDVAIKNSKNNKRILYLSLEMDRESIHRRYARNYASIDKAQWRDRRIEEWQKKAYIKAKKYIKSIDNLTLQGFNLDVPLTTKNILKYFEEVKDDYDLIFLDNFGNISRQGTQLEHEMGTSRDIASFAKQYSIPIILIHHFKKVKATGLRALEDLSGSAKFGDNATNVIQVWRDAENDPRTTKIVEMKDRGFGVRGWANVCFDKGVFTDEMEASPDGVNEIFNN